MALRIAAQPARIPARIERIGKVEEGNYGPYRSVLFKGDFTQGMDSVKTAGELWRRVPCETSDEMAVGMGLILSLIPGKSGGMVWDIALDPEAAPVTGPTAGQQQQAPAPTQYQPAPASTGYPASGPLDRVGEQGREELLNAELTVRVKLANQAMQATAKSMALAMKTMEDNGVVFSGPIDFAAIAEPMARIVNTHLMGLTDQRSYFGGASQNAPHQ
jgi:hypothetical protein